MDKENILKKMKDAVSAMKNLSADGFEEKCPVSNIDIDKWEWPQGIGMYALYKYYKITHEEEILQWLIRWYDNHVAKGLPPKNINTVSPLLALTYLYEITHKEEYLEVIKEWSEYIFDSFARTEENGFQHSGSGVDNLYGQLWDDTLVMTCLFLGRAGMLLGKKEYIYDAEHQFLLHAKYLSDSETGLWYHGWTFNGRHNFGKAFWGRGNCWITIAIPEFLQLEISESVRTFLIGTLLAQVKALEKYQDESGMWHTLIDYNDSYVEASATAGFGYGILKGIHDGYLPEKFVLMGESYLKGDSLWMKSRSTIAL